MCRILLASMSIVFIANRRFMFWMKTEKASLRDVPVDIILNIISLLIANDLIISGYSKRID